MNKTKPAVASKINWTQAISVLAMLLSTAGLELSPETQLAVVSTIVAIQSFLTVVFRTWFSDTKIAGILG